MAQQISGNDMQGWGGWIPMATCTFSSSNVMIVDSATAAALDKGDKIWLASNGIAGAKYFYVTAVSGTSITITGGSDYTFTNNTISGPAYSKMATPAGFPQWFNWSPTWSGFSAGPSGGITRFKIDGRTVTCAIHPATNGTSNSISTSISLPVTASSLAGAYWRGINGAATDNGVTQTAASEWNINSGGTTVGVYLTAAAGNWTASGSKLWTGQITYEF